MNLKLIAWKFSLKNNINNFFVNLEDLFDIIRANGWEIFSYKENVSLIESLNLKEHIKTADAFLYNFKVVKDGNLTNKIIIFYKDELSYNEKIFCILHEIGHILTKHISFKDTMYKISGSVLDENDFVQEKEADIFAFEVLAPSCIIKFLNVSSFTDIKNLTMIPEKYIDEYIEYFNTVKINSIYKESFYLYKSYIPYLIKFGLKKLRLISIPRILSTLVILIIVFLLGVFNGSRQQITFEQSVIKYIDKNHVEVYVSKTGSKYHKEDCFHLKKDTSRNIGKDEMDKYEPCKICFKNVKR